MQTNFLNTWQRVKWILFCEIECKQSNVRMLLFACKFIPESPRHQWVREPAWQSAIFGLHSLHMLQLQIWRIITSNSIGYMCLDDNLNARPEMQQVRNSNLPRQNVRFYGPTSMYALVDIEWMRNNTHLVRMYRVLRSNCEAATRLHVQAVHCGGILCKIRPGDQRNQ